MEILGSNLQNSIKELEITFIFMLLCRNKPLLKVDQVLIHIFLAENEEIFSSLPPRTVDWNIRLFTKSVNHLDRKKELKKRASSSTYKVWRSI
jgi:hypothetical protein